MDRSPNDSDFEALVEWAGNLEEGIPDDQLNEEAPRYWADLDQSFNEYTREVYGPKVLKSHPKGVVMVTGGDFVTVACLPYRFAGLSTREIVVALWPQSAVSATFNPDYIGPPKYASSWSMQ